MTESNGEFELTGWDEHPYEDLGDGAKLTRASVTQSFTGVIAGDGSVEWLMCYRSDGTARFVGLQLVRGTVDGRQGSFVLDTAGDFDGTTASWTGSVIPGSGTGELNELRGEAKFGAAHGSQASFSFDYKLG